MHKNLYTWLFFLNFDSSNNIENYLHSNEMNVFPDRQVQIIKNKW